jgi:outer membrane lipoprotein-sorting protein
MIRFGVLSFVVHAAMAQAPPGAAEILKRVEEVYKDVSQYDLVTTLTLHDPDSGRDVSGSMRIVYKAPDKYREEAKGTFLALGQDASGPPIDEGIIVYDGVKISAYMPKSNEYRVYTIPNIPRDSRPEDVDIFEGIGPYRHALEAFPTARLQREERLETSAGPVDCFVLGATGKEGNTAIWVDKSNYHVLRLDAGVEGYRTSVMLNVKLNGVFSDDLFKFVPPAGARKLE